MDKFKRYLWLSQINLYAWLIICSFIASSVVFENGGISNYGNHYSTTPFYATAFLAVTIYLYMAAESLLMLHKKFKNVARYLHVLCVMFLLVFFTTFPRRFGVIFSDIHDKISIALFGYELILAFWLLFKRPVLETIVYVLIMATGTAIGMLSAVHVLKLMFVGQMVGEIGFSLLLVFVLPKVIAKDLVKTSHKK